MKTLMQWTVKDYHRLIETGIFSDRCVELLQGEIVEMPPEGPIHAYLTDGIVNYLRHLLKGIALVREAHPITLSNSEPAPDIAIVRLPRQRYQDRHPYPEDIYWLIEISQSTLDYDLSEKKKTYAKEGILEYWVIDTKARQLYRFLNPIAENYTSKTLIQVGNLTPQAFPDIQVSVSQLWK